MSLNVLRLCWVSLLLFLMTACAARKVEVPSFPGGDIREALAEKRAVTDIETTFSIVFEKAGSETRGDGALTIASSGDMDLRVYSLGFLAMELTAVDGVVRSTPRLDTGKKIMLSEGLKDCIFWWGLEGFAVEEEADMFVIKNSNRTVWVDRKSFLPRRQLVQLTDGKELTVYYDEPVRENGLWYQSRIRIEYSRYAVALTVKSLSVKPGVKACSYCSL